MLYKTLKRFFFIVSIRLHCRNKSNSSGLFCKKYLLVADLVTTLSCKLFLLWLPVFRVLWYVSQEHVSHNMCLSSAYLIIQKSLVLQSLIG